MADETNPDVKLAFDTIRNKKRPYDELHRYYAGFHPLRYSSSKLEKVFERLDAYFVENWIGVVIDAVIERLVLNGFDISKDNNAKSIMDDLWRDFNINLVADDVHESCSIVSEGYVIAAKVIDEDTEQEELQVYFNDARLCHMFYDEEQPNKKRLAAKLWQDHEGYTRMTLFYHDEYQHYRSRTPQKIGSLVTNAKHLEPDPDMPTEVNDFDTIPVFHWTTSRTTRKRDIGPSEISIQDAINKLLTDMMISSEFNAFVQRVIISKADPGNMPNTPGSNWWLPASDEGQGTQVVELGAGRPLEGYFNGIDKLATALAITTRTPKHYFYAQGGDPSGEALIALEAPLVKKVRKKQARYSTEWQAFVQFLLKLENIDIKRNQIVLLWEPAETVQPKTRAEIVKTETEAGIPLITSLRERGWSEDKIKQLVADMKEEQKRQSSLAKAALDELRKEDEQDNTPNDTL